MSAELVELAKSYKAGLWGFQLLANAISPDQTVLSVDIPGWMARAWTITLLSQRYAQGVLSATSLPDSQAFVEPLQCKLTWGVGGAGERAVIDYPHQGTTFQIHASMIRMTMNIGVLSAIPPLIGAFVSPSPRSSVHGMSLPTFTALVTLTPVTASAFIAAPDRAVAYRLVPRDAEAAVNAVSVVEQGPNGTTRAIDYGQPDSLIVTDSALAGHLFTQRQMYIPIDYRCTGLIITNQGVAGTAEWLVQWLLDLG